MKTHLEAATEEHVQTFARELDELDDLDARSVGFRSAVSGYLELTRTSLEAWALVEPFHLMLEPGARRTRVHAMCGVLSGSRLWVHTAPVLKQGGLGSLKLVRRLVLELLERHGPLTIDVDAANGALVRMADWLGFKHTGFIEKHGRPFHHAVLRRRAAA